MRWDGGVGHNAVVELTGKMVISKVGWKDEKSMTDITLMFAFGTEFHGLRLGFLLFFIYHVSDSV